MKLKIIKRKKRKLKDNRRCIVQSVVCGTGRGADYIRGEEGQQGGGAECRLLTSGCFLWAKSSAAGAGNETVMV